MPTRTIYRTEPMATRALAAEIRHDCTRFIALLQQRSGLDFGEFESVQCEVKRKVVGGSRPAVRVDIELQFHDHRVGIEAKLDHELTPMQIDDQLLALGEAATLFVLLPNVDAAPNWLSNYPHVRLLGWREALGCFEDSRLTMDDIEGEGRLLKSTVEGWLGDLRVDLLLPNWDVYVDRGQGGMPSIVFWSPLLPDGKQLGGQIEVDGQGMPRSLEEVRFSGYVGISVDDESEQDFFDPAKSSAVPGWIYHLLLLHRAVLAGEEMRLRVETRKPSPGKKNLGVHKIALAERYLRSSDDPDVSLAYLAKGYVTSALGPKLAKVSKDGLGDLAASMVEIFERWYKEELACGDSEPSHRAA